MKFNNFFESGQTFTPDEYQLKNKYILANALLLAAFVNMLVFYILMYSVNFDAYLNINLFTALIILFVIGLLRIIPKEDFEAFTYGIFLLFLSVVFYAYAMYPNKFPGPTWFIVLIIPSFFIVGFYFAMILSFFSVVLLTLLYQTILLQHNIGVVFADLSPVVLSIWFAYFYHQRYEHSIEMIKEKHKYMLHQSRMASMGEMIENIAHQWRQPLSQINSAILLLDGVLKKENIKNDCIEEKLLEIESLTMFMSHTIDDFKNFLEPDKTVVVYSLDDTIEYVVKIVKSVLIRYEIKWEYIYKNITLKGYPNELQQVILVIVNNAIEHLLLNSVENPKIVIESKMMENNVFISIEDNAGGIDIQIIRKIFHPYFTTKKSKNGNGIGLYMSKIMIEDSMKGTLSVENINKGVRFTIQIPKEILV